MSFLSSLVQESYYSVYKVLETLLDKSVLYYNRDSAIECVAKDNHHMLYHVGSTFLGGKVMLQYDFISVFIEEKDDRTNVTLIFNLVKYFNGQMVDTGRCLTSAMKSIANYILSRLADDINVCVKKMNLKDDHTIISSKTQALFSTIDIPSPFNDIGSFVCYERVDRDDNCLRLEIVMDIINEKDYEIGGKAYQKGEERFNKMK